MRWNLDIKGIGKFKGDNFEELESLVDKGLKIKINGSHLKVID